jgi:hypothetical protein
LPHEDQDAFCLPRGRLGSLVRPRHLDRNAFPHARPEMACRYRTGRVALRETACLKIVPQVREEGKRPPARQGAAMAASPCGRARGSCMRADNQCATRAPFHSITSSARASSVGGIVRPSVLAVLLFMISSNRVGCSTGRSLGFVPLKILST